MSEIIADQLPLIAAGVALLAGVLLGRKAIANISNAWVTGVGIATFLVAMLFGNKLTGWLLMVLIGAGAPVTVAKYASVCLISFISGIVLAIVLKKKPDTATSA